MAPELTCGLGGQHAAELGEDVALRLGVGRIIDLHHRASPTAYQIHSGMNSARLGTSTSETTHATELRASGSGSGSGPSPDPGPSPGAAGPIGCSASITTARPDAFSCAAA